MKPVIGLIALLGISLITLSVLEQNRYESDLINNCNLFGGRIVKVYGDVPMCTDKVYN